MMEISSDAMEIEYFEYPSSDTSRIFPCLAFGRAKRPSSPETVPSMMEESAAALATTLAKAMGLPATSEILPETCALTIVAANVAAISKNNLFIFVLFL